MCKGFVFKGKFEVVVSKTFSYDSKSKIGRFEKHFVCQNSEMIVANTMKKENILKYPNIFILQNSIFDSKNLVSNVKDEIKHKKKI